MRIDLIHKITHTQRMWLDLIHVSKEMWLDLYILYFYRINDSMRMYTHVHKSVHFYTCTHKECDLIINTYTRNVTWFNTHVHTINVTWFNTHVHTRNVTWL